LEAVKVSTGTLELSISKMAELTQDNGLPFKRRRSNGLVSEQLSSQMALNIKDKPRRDSSTAREE
jgi:hypothetical protein